MLEAALVTSMVQPACAALSSGMVCLLPGRGRDKAEPAGGGGDARFAGDVDYND